MSLRRSAVGDDGRADLARGLRRKGDQALSLGSALYGELFSEAARDAERGGPVWELLREHSGDPVGSALGLRFAAAIHRVVLEGDAPGLAAHYPSAGGSAGRPGLWPAVMELLGEHEPRLRELVTHPVQTNEVGRCAALLAGFLSVARATGLPLAILEIGASAGLNLLWDRYRYEAGGLGWGPPDSAVAFAGMFEGRLPPLEVATRVLSRRGCDLRPLDPGSEDTRLQLLSTTWPDQADRVQRLHAALELAAADPPAVDVAGAAAWVQAQLAVPRPGVATIVFHSIVWQYIPEDERRRLLAAIDAAGRRATPIAPLAYLRMEPEGALLTSVALTTWPGAAHTIVARAGYHGGPIIGCG